MYFSFAFYTVATALVLVQGQEFEHPEPDGPHEYDKIGHCRNWRSEFKISRMNAALKPRERHVILKPKEGFEFDPSTVSVKRCMGACSERLSPMPMKKEPKSFVVQMNRKGERGSAAMCVSVTVMEHTACRCMCMRNETSCNKLQTWNQSRCGCDCKADMKTKSICEAMDGMVWNDEECSCRCYKQLHDCPNSWHWDMKTCSCCQDGTKCTADI